jgi:uncharacterized iron-regulated membrane protein
MSTISEVTPSPFDVRQETAHDDPVAPKIGFDAIVARATDDAHARAWREPIGDIFYAQNFGIYGVRFFAPGDDHGAAGVGPPVLYYDGGDGRYLGDLQPWTGTVADIFVQAQFPLHSGRILGLPGRILVSVMGVVTAALAVTGVVIWWKRRAARQRRDTPVASAHANPAE